MHVMSWATLGPRRRYNRHVSHLPTAALVGVIEADLGCLDPRDHTLTLYAMDECRRNVET